MKCLEFNQTKAIVRVYASRSNVLYSLYTNTHPLYSVIIKLENVYNIIQHVLD